MIDFDTLEEVTLKNFKGGDKEVKARMMMDDTIKIMKSTLLKGASIGYHTHTHSSEIIYVLSGEAEITHNGKEETLKAGCAHYCKDGESHSIRNEKDEPLVLFCVVPVLK